MEFFFEGYTSEFYDEKTAEASADPVVASLGMETTGINAALAALPPTDMCMAPPASAPP